jgi:hypothetical protein
LRSNIMLTRLLSFHIPDAHKLGNLASRRHADLRLASLMRAGCSVRPLDGATLFSLEARVVAGDALCEHKIPISRFEHVQRHFLSRVLKERASGILAVIGRIETSDDVPPAQGCCVGDVRRQRRRRSYQIPAAQSERWKQLASIFSLITSALACPAARHKRSSPIRACSRISTE